MKPIDKLNMLALAIPCVHKEFNEAQLHSQASLTDQLYKEIDRLNKLNRDQAYVINEMKYNFKTISELTAAINRVCGKDESL